LHNTLINLQGKKTITSSTKWNYQL